MILEYNGSTLFTTDPITFEVGTSARDIVTLFGGVSIRPMTRWETICDEIRKQRYVLLRDPHPDTDDWFDE